MYEIFLTLHLIGVVLGAGAAFVSDSLFFGIIRDRQVEKSELNLLKRVSFMVWMGLLVMFISGFVLVVLADFAFLTSPAFQVKMLLVGVIAINGMVFHIKHLPFLELLSKKKDFAKDIENKLSSWVSFKHMFASGSISMVSWVSVILIASLKKVFPLSFLEFGELYILGLIFSFFASYFLLRHMFPKHKSLEIKKHSFKRGLIPYLLVVVFLIILLSRALYFIKNVF